MSSIGLSDFRSSHRGIQAVRGAYSVHSTMKYFVVLYDPLVLCYRLSLFNNLKVCDPFCKKEPYSRET